MVLAALDFIVAALCAFAALRAHDEGKPFASGSCATLAIVLAGLGIIGVTFELTSP